jgi:predicted acyltransferase
MSTDAKPSLVLSDRLLSIDALRGFDMFWIMGAEDIFRQWARWGNWPFKDLIETQLEHVEWDGFRFYDLIFPLFLFLVGAVLPFSLGKLREKGVPRSTLYWRVLRRTALLFALGLLCNNALQFDFENLRIAGVLQRIALCYGLAALVVLNTGAIGQTLITVAILAGYWALLAYVPAPGSAPGDFSKLGNLPGYIDAHYLPGKIMKAYYGYGDNEGILSTIPAVATVLLGALAGQWLRSGKAPGIKVVGLMVAGIVCLATGVIWGRLAVGTPWERWVPVIPGFWFPVVKNIWTSSFVLVAGGWSLLLLALFYWIIDVLRFRAWAFFFAVIGANAITIYVVPHFIDFHRMGKFFFGGLYKHAGSFLPVAMELGAFAMAWLLLYFLYRHRLFLRV